MSGDALTLNVFSLPLRRGQRLSAEVQLGLGFELREQETIALAAELGDGHGQAMATETLHPGRRMVLHVPLADGHSVSIAVLDSPTECDEVACAAVLVAAGEERNWIYASEGGQWQLLATAAVSRMLIVTRISSPPPHPRCLRCDDDALKARLRFIVVALAPRVCFRSGVPVVPFVDYSDNVIHRVVVEELDSSLTGSMVVEDVAVDDSHSEVHGSESFVSREWNDELEAECSHRVDDRVCRNLDGVSYRRRLRFMCMPNLIQTEVPLVMHQGLGNCEMAMAPTAVAKGSIGAFCEEVISGSRIDHSWLVHKYLPSIVAGLVLAASCIEPCMERGEKAKVLTLGVGGGALQVFLQKHLGFRVQAVDVDKVVLDAAHRHFGLEDGVDMEVKVGDALQFVAELATNVRAEDASRNPPNSTSEKLADAAPGCRNSVNASAAEGEDVLGRACSALNAVAPSSSSVDICQVNGSKRGYDNHRVHAIIVDVDEGDPRCGLSSPPSSFLENKFLTAARTVLHEGGLLAMNVVPNGAKSYHGVVSSLFSVFDDVYETVVEGDVNRVVFGLSSKGTGVNLDGPLARLVKRFLDVRLISAIQRAHIEV